MSLSRLPVPVLMLLACSGALTAQTGSCTAGSESSTSITINCPQGTPISVDFGSGFSELASLLNGVDGISFTYSITETGSLPPGTSFSSSGLFTGTLAAAGTFSFTVNISETISFDGMTYPVSDSFGYTFVVSPYTGASTLVAPSGLGFSLTQGAAASTQSVSIANQSSQAATYQASAITNSGGNWLSVSPASGSVASFGAASVSVTANPSNLQAGTYSGVVTISIAGGQSYTVSVLATVAGNQPNIQLSQSGLRFEAVTGGSATPPQVISVLNTGAGTLNFSATASTVSGGNWLSVSQTASSVTVSVNPAGLAAGNYYGQIKFAAQGAANSPQIASVVLNVLSLANSPGAFVNPSGLIFVGTAGGVSPMAKSLSITNPSPTALTFLATPFVNSGTNWINFSPSSGSVSATQPATINVQADLQGLSAGIYTGELVLNIVPASGSSTASQTLHIEILLIVLPPGGSAANVTAENPRASGCTPTKLLPVFTQLATGFTTTAAWPTAIEVTVVDDCGNPMVSGSVVTTFSSGDPALSLTSLKDGRWAATWQPVHSASQVTVSAKAQQLQPALQGTQSVGGTLQANPTVPLVPAGSVVSAASFAANQPLAPGAYAAIFGTNLSQSSSASQQLPLNAQLGVTSVTLAGQPLPLLNVTNLGTYQQINAVIPYDIPANSTQQIVVQTGSSISVPQTVMIATAQPAIFTQNSSGSGAGIFTAVKSDGVTPVPAGTPVSANDVITIYCTGLGAVNPPVPAGSAAPSAPLSNTVNQATARLGGVPATVLFAGLAPGFAQLYQMNIVIPSGVTSGNAALVVSVSGQQSSPVTIPVQ